MWDVSLGYEYGLDEKQALPEELTQVVHSSFEPVAHAVAHDVPVYLYGPAGSGKNVLVEQVARMLDLDFHFMGCVTDEFKLAGFADAAGTYHETEFYRAFKYGGIFFLDEFDAIAKRRDDEGDLGELKRLVNVLLKEIETCPKGSIVLAATNHPELLDRAIWRRFDRVIEVPLPEENERMRLFERHLPSDRFTLSQEMLFLMVEKSAGMSAADICKLCEHIKRQSVMNPGESIEIISLSELYSKCKPQTKQEKSEACIKLREINPALTVRDIARIVGVGASTVSRYMKEA